MQNRRAAGSLIDVPPSGNGITVEIIEALRDECATLLSDFLSRMRRQEIKA